MSAAIHSDQRSIAELIADHQSGYSLEQRFYTDPDIYELEIENVVNRNWILAGHVSQFAAPGDTVWVEVYYQREMHWSRVMAEATVVDKPLWFPPRRSATPPGPF